MFADPPALPYGELAPAFALEGTNGSRVTRSQFRDRRLLVLLFFAPDAAPEPLLSGLAAEGERLTWLEAEVLAIVPSAASELPPDQPPLRYLADPTLNATRHFTPLIEHQPRTAVVLLDRYGAVEQRWLDPELPSAKVLLQHVERLAHLCSG